MTGSTSYCISLLPWRQNLWLNHDSDNDDEIEGTTHSATRGVHLSKCSHAMANLADIVSALGLNRLPGAIQRYIADQDISIISHSHFLYQTHNDVPPWAQQLHIWYHSHLVSKRINHFYLPESTQIYCCYKLLEDSLPALFNTLLIETNVSAWTPQQHALNLHI